MTNNLASPILILVLVVVTPLALFLVSMWKLRTSKEASPLKRRLWSIVCGISILPILGIITLISLFVAANFPFTSGIIADVSAPTGEEVCVVQTFKGAEPYQVSLYARAPRSPWVWHYLAHQDDRWRNCHVEFVGTELRVYNGDELRKALPLAEATAPPQYPREELPSNYTPKQILQHHNKKFRQ